MNEIPTKASNLPDIPAGLFDLANETASLLNDSVIPIGAKILAIYSYIEVFNKEYTSQFATCSKSCSYCCHYNVQMTTLEAEVIFAQKNIKYNQYARQQGHSGEPCTFLTKSGDCGIYEVRPMVCRMYHSASNPEYCKISSREPSSQYGVPPYYGNNIFQKMMHVVLKMNSDIEGTVADIRDFFG